MNHLKIKTISLVIAAGLSNISVSQDCYDPTGMMCAKPGTANSTASREQGASFKAASTLVKAKDGTSIRVPNLQWERTELERTTTDSRGFKRKGEFSRITGASEATVLVGRDGGNVSAGNSQISNIIKDTPVGAAYVLGTYDPMEKRLNIRVFRMEKLPKGDPVLVQARFTPEFGAAYQAGKAFISDADLRAGRFGLNPFAQFTNPNNSIPNDGFSFYNVTMSGAMMISGMAGQYVGADRITISYPDVLVATSVIPRGTAWRRTFDTHIESWVKPRFIVGSPAGITDLLAAGISRGCAVENTTTCPSYAVINSGYTFGEYKNEMYLTTTGRDLVGGSIYKDYRSSGWDRVAYFTQSGPVAMNASQAALSSLGVLGLGELTSMNGLDGVNNAFYKNVHGIPTSAASLNPNSGNTNSQLSNSVSLPAGYKGFTIIRSLDDLQKGSSSVVTAQVSEPDGSYAIDAFKNEPNVGRATAQFISQGYSDNLNTSVPRDGTTLGNRVINEIAVRGSNPDVYLEVDIGRALSTGQAYSSNMVLDKLN